MRSSRIPPVLLAVVLAVTMLATAAPSGAIVGGTPLNQGTFPFFVEVGGHCGGALISPRRVLTAAHCRSVVDTTPYVRVAATGERIAIRKFALPPRYVRALANRTREFPPPAPDLMVLQLTRRSVAPPVEIATDDEATAPGGLVTTIGRGATNPNGKGAGVLRGGVVELQRNRTCRQQLSGVRERTWSLCTRDPRSLDPGGTPPWVSACVGDSGSPLLVPRETSFAVVGVVSWGPSCGTTVGSNGLMDPEIYTNAVLGRTFALSPRLLWTPRPRGTPRLVGRAGVGGTLTCRVGWIAQPERVVYDFVSQGQRLRSSASPRLRVTAAMRGRTISCAATGSNAAGRAGTALSDGRRIS